VKFGPQTAEI